MHASEETPLDPSTKKVGMEQTKQLKSQYGQGWGVQIGMVGGVGVIAIIASIIYKEIRFPIGQMNT